MPDRLHLLVDATPLGVEVRPDGIVVDGDDGRLHHVVALEDGRYRIDGPSGPVDAIATISGNRIWIAIGDETFECRMAGLSPPSGASRAGVALSSPMPATVTAVPVRVGQTVEAGQVLIALEAMKMELPLRAPQSAVVVALYCSVGDLVQPDVVLVELGDGPPTVS